MPETNREAFERRSRPLLARVLTLPRWLLFGSTLLLLAIGVLVPGYPGALAFLVMAAYLAWLAALSWPVATTGTRVLRSLGVVLLLIFAIADVGLGLS